MKCPICNSPLRDGAVFCPYCGTRVGRSFEFENEFANQGATGEPQEEEQTNPYQFEGVREETSPEDFEDFDVDSLMDEAEAAAVIPDRTEQELKDLVMDVSEINAPHPAHAPAQTPFTAQIREAADLNEEITIAPNAGVAQPSAMELLKSSKEGEDIYQTRFGVPSKSQEVIGGMQEQTASEIARKMARAQQMQQTMGAAAGMTAAEMLTNMNRQQAEEAAAQAAAAPATPAMPAKPEPPLTAQEMLRARQEAKAAATQEAQEAVPAPEQAGPVIPETIGEADIPAGPVLPEAAQPEMMQETPAAPGMGAAAGMAAGAAAGVAAGAAVTAAAAGAAGAAQAQGAVQTGSVAAQIAAGMIPEGMTAQQAAYLRQQQQMQQMFMRQQQQMQQQGAPAMPQYGYPYAYPYPYNPYAQGQMNPMQAADATAAGIAAESEESAAVFAAASGRQVVRPEQPQGAPAGARTVAAGTVAGAAAGMAAGAGMTQAGAAAGTGAAGAYPAAAGAGMGASVPPYGARPDAADSAEIAMAAGKGAGADGKGKAAGKASKKTLTKKNAAAAGGTGTGDVDEQDKEKKQRTAIYILAAVVGILVIIAFVIFFRRMRGGNVTEPAGTELAETAVTDGAVPAEGEAGEATGDGTGAEAAAPEEVAPTDQIDSLIAQGDFEEAIRMIDEAYRLNPSEDLVTYYTMAYRTWSDALLAEGDYETAIRQLEEASRIDADNEDVKAATVRAYRDWAEMFIQNSEYEEAIAKLDAAALKTSDESVLTEDYVRAYLAWGQYYETEGDIEQALNVLNQGYGKTSSNDIARRYNELAVNADGTAVATGNGENASGDDASGGDTSGDDTEGGSSSGGSRGSSSGGSSSGGSSGGSSSGGSSSGGSRGSSSGGSSGGSSSGGSSGGSSSGSSSGGSSSSGNNIGSFLTNIATASQSNNTSNVASNMRDSSFRSSAQSLINQYNGPISYDTSGTSVGVYPVGGSLMAYVGNYSTSNLRTGAANWYDVTGSETYVAKGSWSNDAPNGSFTATWTGSNYEVTYSGNVKNGLWDGPVNISWTQNGSTMNYTANATNGLFTQIGTDQNGYPMIAKNGDQGISVTQSELSTPAGIRGYGYAQVQ